MKTYRQFNDSLTGKMKPITNKSMLSQWLTRYKFNKAEVIHRNEINEDPNEALKWLSSKIKYSKGNLSIVVIEE